MINKYFLSKMNIPAYLKKFLYERYGYNEIEGIPPIIFKGNGKNLLDYRIDGANGGVGDKTSNLLNSINTQRVTANGIEYYKENGIYHLIGTNTKTDSSWVLPNPQNTKLPVFEIGKTYTILVSGNMANNIYIQMNGVNVNTNTQYSIAIVRNTNPIVNFTIDNRYLKTAQIFVGVTGNATNVDSEFSIYIGENSTYEPYGYKVPVVITGKNLLPPIANWVKGYINSEGTITNATESKQISSPFIQINSNKNFTFSFYPNSGSPWGCIAFYTDNKDYIDRVADYENTTIFATSPNNAKYIRVSYRTYGAGTYAQLDEGSKTDYEPYHELTTNIYLDEPIGENESISLSDTNTNIPTLRGTNVLTVDTTVQPSNVYIKVGGG